MSLTDLFKRKKKEDKKEIKQETEESKGIQTEIEGETKERRNWLSHLRDRLSKSRGGLVDRLGQIFSGRAKIDEELYEELEEVLIQADTGVNTTTRIVADLRERVKQDKVKEPAQLYELVKEEIRAILGEKVTPLQMKRGGLTVLLVVGVNGTGKTTAIGKLAQQFKDAGLKPLLAAGDTFRAAAIEQLEIWGKRVGAEVIKHQPGADAAAVVYDAIQAAQARQVDVVLVDTAGRLHTKKNLMEELKKVKRVIAKAIPDAPQEVLLAMDATTGQNGMSQAHLFNEAVGITGLILTKLDGTAKGGIIIAIADELGIPVKYIGIGEGVNDLSPFDPNDFVEALFTTNGN